jgi:hypothetical protein
VDGQRRAPNKVYRKVRAVQLAVLTGAPSKRDPVLLRAVDH